MSDDIVARLRDWKRAADGSGYGSLLGIFDEAADEIEKLRSELRNYTGDHHTIGGTRVE